MAKTTLPSQALDPKAIFVQAVQFANADKVLRQQKLNAGMNAFNVPITVISIFAIELYMKCIIVMENPSFTSDDIRTHELSDLFSMFSDNARLSIIDRWNSSPFIKPAIRNLNKQIEKDIKEGRMKQEPGFKYTLQTDLVGALAESRGSFERLRYIYEGRSTKFHIWGLPDILFGYIAERRPDWALGQ